MTDATMLQYPTVAQVCAAWGLPDLALYGPPADDAEVLLLQPPAEGRPYWTLQRYDATGQSCYDALDAPVSDDDAAAIIAVCTAH